MARLLLGIWRVLLRPGPTGGGGLLLEDGNGFLLLEDGYFLILE